ncbi:Cytoplasmic tRNA 2-thiolation protein 2 [Maublancomyces gigas]|uniref:Cytoplasmic tRNA 2-thiolation protein 2 n=1 Tax=Discina gigas TaxID=1032678 RepID=A0ABR3GBM0_9PEZI
MAATDPENGLRDRGEPAIQKCKRCRENTAVVVVRQENLCCECFDKYVRSKCIKRMETYRVRYPDTAPRTLLLPVSFGISSTTLLYLLCGQLARQSSQAGRTGFSLLIVHVDETCIDSSLPPRSHLDALRSRFPDAGHYTAVGIEDIYQFRNAAREVELAAGVDEEKAHGGFDAREAVRNLLGALASPTSRTDVLAVLRTRLVVEIAKREGCEGVLWGDTTTRLAEKTLGETAKGRGFSIPWRTADGDSPFGVKFHYPLRDLLKSELVNYVSLSLPASREPLLLLCAAYSAQPKHSAASAASGRNITIDELMTQYFESIETQYPSIVANVVRTAGKLQPLRGSADGGHCMICGLPGDGAGGDMTLSALTLNAGADEGEKPRNGNKRSDMCYGCARSTYGAASYDWPLEP